MRKMKRSDVREWTLGETLERVDFGHGCTGMDKSMPKEPGQEGDFKRLIWKCRAIETDGGPSIEVLPSEYWIGDVKQGGYFDVFAGASSFGPFRFDDAWTYLNGIEEGWRLAGGERHSGLHEVLSDLFSGEDGACIRRVLAIWVAVSCMLAGVVVAVSPWINN